MWKIDSLLSDKSVSKTLIDNKWVIARPENYKRKNTTIKFRLREAWNVLTGRAETLYYYKQ